MHTQNNTTQKPSATAEVRAHKGYLIKDCGGHGLSIQKDKFHIGWAKTNIEAKAIIDQLTEI